MKRVALTGRVGVAREELRPIMTQQAVAKLLGTSRYMVKVTERRAMAKLFEGLTRQFADDPKLRDLLIDMGLSLEPTTTAEGLCLDVCERPSLGKLIRYEIDGKRRMAKNVRLRAEGAEVAEVVDVRLRT